MSCDMRELCGELRHPLPDQFCIQNRRFPSGRHASPGCVHGSRLRPHMVATMRVLLIVQIACGVVAMVALSVLLVDETTIPFGYEVPLAAFTVAIVVLVAWVALAAAIAVALFGQYRARPGSRPRWWAITGLEALVILVGTALETYLLVPTLFGVPAPPAPNVVLALVVPALAAINLAMFIAIRESTEATSAL